MRAFLDIALTGVDSLLLHPLRNVVTLLCLVIVLTPLVAGIGISKGVQQDAEISVSSGADLYLSGEQFGRPAAIPQSAAELVRGIDGVERVTPRIVGAITLGANREPAVVVGVPAAALPASVECVDGRLFAAEGAAELVIGSELARRLKLAPGMRVPPFYQNRQGERVAQVVGVFRADVSLWQSHVVFTSLHFAAEIFDQQGQATDLLVDCRSGYADGVRRQIVRTLSPDSLGAPPATRVRVISRDELAAVLPRGLLHREGVFSLHMLLACVVGGLVMLVTSGIGLSERRREIGILKATGWQTDEVLLRSLVESLLLSLLGAALAVILAFVWLRWLNGFGVAGVFLADVGVYPAFPVPFRLAAMPVIVAFIFSFAIAASGTLYATWRSAITSPREAMR